MNFAVRRGDRDPNKCSRVCSCHFRDGDKQNLPTMSNRNKYKLFDLMHGAEARCPRVKKVKLTTDTTLPTVKSVLAEIKGNCGPSASTNKQDESRDTSFVEIEVDMASRELTKHKKLSGYQREHYSMANLGTEVIRMETVFPTEEVFYIIVNYVAIFKGHINYYSGWNAQAITLKDKVFITLMTMKQNYSNLHVALLFLYSVKVNRVCVEDARSKLMAL